MPAKLNDVRFAQEMITMARADVERAVAHPQSPVRRAVAVWMTHEVERVLPGLSLQRAEAHAMVKEAQTLRQRVIHAAGRQRFSETAEKPAYRKVV